jgi:hypothetical protein
MMAAISYEQEILEQIRDMNEEQQKEVLAFVRSLRRPKGISGLEAIRIADEINFPKEDLAEIAEAIQEMRMNVPDFGKEDIDFDAQLPS